MRRTAQGARVRRPSSHEPEEEGGVDLTHLGGLYRAALLLSRTTRAASESFYPHTDMRTQRHCVSLGPRAPAPNGARRGPSINRVERCRIARPQAASFLSNIPQLEP
jgi:hypothetical protein